MRGEHPRFRTDLDVQRRETEDGLVHQLRDPESGAFYRFREIEYLIATRFDGETAPDEVRRRVEEERGITLSEETFNAFLARLREFDLFESEGRRRTPRRRVQGTPLHLRVRVVDPDRFLHWLVGPLAFCFTKTFVAACGALIAWAAVVFASEHARISREVLALFDNPQAILAGVAVVLLVTVLHELAHGATCKRFGGEVHEIGFLLIYLQPALYCDVSDAWRFRRKSHRSWVTFAGALCELSCWAVAVLAWRVTRPETWIHDTALCVVAASGVRTLFNFNPLIKLDGYYLLSDWLDVPNLRRRAFRHSWGSLKRLFGRADDTREVSARLRRIYLAYGLLAAAYSISLLGLVAFKLGGYLVSELHELGLVMTAGVVLLVARRPLGRLLTGGRAAVADRAPVVRRWSTRLAWLTGVVAGGYVVLFSLTLPLRITGEFRVSPVRKSQLRTEVAGFVEEILVEEGDHVSAGQVVARLANPDLRADLDRVSAELREKRAELDGLLAGPRDEDVELARREVETARAQRAAAKRRLEEAERLRVERLARAESRLAAAEVELAAGRRRVERFDRLHVNRAATSEMVERARADLAVAEEGVRTARAGVRLIESEDDSELREKQTLAEAALAEARARLDVLLAGTRDERVEAARAVVQRLEHRRRFLEERLQRMRIVSPIGGVVTSGHLKDERGRWAEPGELLVVVEALEEVRLEIEVPERETSDVASGQPVSLKARSLPLRTFHTKLTRLAPTLDEPDDEETVRHLRAIAELSNAELRLKPGMTGTARIDCGERRVADLVVRRLSRWLRVEFWPVW